MEHVRLRSSCGADTLIGFGPFYRPIPSMRDFGFYARSASPSSSSPAWW